jgi:hypothetical protein
MSQFSGRNGFAVGLTLGLCLALLVYLFFGSGTKIPEEGQISGGFLWNWTGPLVSSADTLAQWIMTAFTIVAVLLVWSTLISTQDMLRETKRLGEAQAQAYVHAEKAFFFWGGETHARPRVEIWVRNSGSTPAKWYEIRVKELVWSHSAPPDRDTLFGQVILPEAFDGPWNAIPPGSEGNKATIVFSGDEEIVSIKRAAQDKLGLSTPSHGFAVVGEIRYQTFFDETFVTQFVFGRAALPSYECKETRTRIVEDITVNDNIERPIPLARLSARLQTYKKG